MPCRSATPTGFPSPFLFSSPIETATLSKRQSSIISKWAVPLITDQFIRSDNCHAGLIIYHLEEFVIEHIEKRIIFSCSNEGEYSGYNPTHTCHVTGVRYSRTDSAVPYTVTVYSAYIIRSTARVSFAVGNPGNLGCVLCRTETAVEWVRAAHGFDCLADILLWLSGLTATAIRRLRSQTTAACELFRCLVA